jgi:tRNA (cytidine/uridine-2'-O-)-methyltransferase
MNFIISYDLYILPIESLDMPLNIVLHQPEIPQNTGSIGRLCVSTDTKLHLIHPLGFDTSDSYLRRAGLDYWHHLNPINYDTWDDFLTKNTILNMWFFTTKGNCNHTEISWHDNDYLVFGKETAGLPNTILEAYPNNLIKIPMPGTFHRSLNLAQAAAIGLYEALRQINMW